MEDIFNNPILCSKCKTQTKDNSIDKNGFRIRIKECPKCNKVILHPLDLRDYENFNKLKSDLLPTIKIPLNKKQVQTIVQNNEKSMKKRIQSLFGNQKLNENSNKLEKFVEIEYNQIKKITVHNNCCHNV